MLISNHTFHCGKGGEINSMFDQIYKVSYGPGSNLFCNTGNKFTGEMHLIKLEITRGNFVMTTDGKNPFEIYFETLVWRCLAFGAYERTVYSKKPSLWSLTCLMGKFLGNILFLTRSATKHGNDIKSYPCRWQQYFKFQFHSAGCGRSWVRFPKWRYCWLSGS